MRNKEIRGKVVRRGETRVCVGGRGDDNNDCEKGKVRLREQRGKVIFPFESRQLSFITLEDVRKIESFEKRASQL